MTPTRNKKPMPSGARRRLRINLIVIGTILAIGAGTVAVTVAQNRPESSATVSPQAVRPDSHRLSTTEDNKVTVVEFLDFECEACGAAWPLVEQLRKQYDGRVTFIARYFPIPSHRNAMNAALAAEAAARQGKFEEMYNRLFQTQKNWGEKQDSQAPYIRTLAVGIGLDMNTFDADIQKSSVYNRVMKDQKDGTALGVTGTPSFFINGKKLEVTSSQDFVDAIETALRK